MAARVYKVWRVDCDCGSVLDYGEDDCTVPEHCEDCNEQLPDPEG